MDVIHPRCAGLDVSKEGCEGLRLHTEPRASSSRLDGDDLGRDDESDPGVAGPPDSRGGDPGRDGGHQ